VLEKRKEPEPEIATYRQAIHQEPDNAQLYCQLAQALVKLGSFTEVIASYKQAITLNPQLAQAYFGLGQVYEHQQDWERAITCYEKTIALEPYRPRVYHKLGIALQSQEKFQQAITAYSNAIKLNPDLSRSHYHLGECFASLGKRSEAIKSYHRTMELEPDFPPVHYQLGEILRGQSKYRKAIASFQQALKLDPNFRLAYIALQYTPVPKPVEDSLIDFYRQLVKEKPELPLAWGNLGDLLTQQQKITEAVSCYQTGCYYSTIAGNPSLGELEWKEKKEECPDFIIIGAAKCGTTSLYRYLSGHPQVLPPHKKELDFFRRNFQKGIDWYLAQFPALSDREEFVTGEATTIYFEMGVVPQRIFKLFPEAKLILLLRDPVARAVSWHYHKVNTGLEKRSLEEAIAAEMKELAGLTEEELVKMGYQPPNNLLGSLYLYRLKRWRRFFPASQMLVLQSEEFWEYPAKIMEQVFAFLGLPPRESSHYPKCNAGAYPPMSENMRSMLKEYFQPYNQKLEAYLGREFNW